MTTTTIALPERLKTELKGFGTKGESYSDILKRLLDNAKKRQLQELLMDERDCVPVGDALMRAKKKWRG